MNPPNTSPQANNQPGLLTQLANLLNGSSFEVVPLLLFALYVIGFLCLNTHLAKFPIIETNIISFNYIKASLVFIVFNVPLLSISRKLAYGFNRGKHLPNFVIFLYVINTYCLFYFIYEIIMMTHADTLTESAAQLRIKALIISYFAFILAWIFHQTKKVYILSLLVFSVIFNIVSLAFLSNSCMIIAIYASCVSCVFFVMFYIDINKASLYVGKKSLFIPMYGFMASLVFAGFGWFIYDKIPQILGGGKPYLAVLYLTKSELATVKESCVLANDEAMNDKVKVIYSSDKGFYIDDNNSVIIIPVESIKGIRVKRWFIKNDETM